MKASGLFSKARAASPLAAAILMTTAFALAPGRPVPRRLRTRLPRTRAVRTRKR